MFIITDIGAKNSKLTCQIYKNNNNKMIAFTNKNNNKHNYSKYFNYQNYDGEILGINESQK